MRPIDADALYAPRSVRKVTEYDETGCGIDFLAVPWEVIEDAPTLNYAPVKRGEWVAVWDADGMMHGVKCSWCGRRVRNTGENYCPRCGAQMEEGWTE